MAFIYLKKYIDAIHIEVRNKWKVNGVKKYLGNFNGEEIFEYKIENKNGLYVTVLNLGGVITGIYTPDKNGKLENIVLSYKDLESYFESPSYYGGVIGRTSGRIHKGEITIGGEKYFLNKNYGVNSGHGGSIGFNKKIWKVKEGHNSLELTLKSPHLEEGYPGEVEVKVLYELNDENEFTFKITGTTTEDTLLNITNHSYFNLSGDYKRDILNEELKITSDKILKIDENGTVTGEEYSVLNTPFDFKDFHKIGERIEDKDEQIALGAGYDHTFMFNGENNIILTDKESGRSMEIETNQESVVVYSMNFPDSLTLKGEKIPKKRMGICFETQAPPIGYNQVFKESSFLSKDQTYSKYTKYKFTNL